MRRVKAAFLDHGSTERQVVPLRLLGPNLLIYVSFLGEHKEIGGLSGQRLRTIGVPGTTGVLKGPRSVVTATERHTSPLEQRQQTATHLVFMEQKGLIIYTSSIVMFMQASPSFLYVAHTLSLPSPQDFIHSIALLQY